MKWHLLKTWINWLLLPLCFFPQQSPEYPNYQYLCKLCSVHIENIQGAHKHIKEKRHKKNIMVGTFKICVATCPCHCFIEEIRVLNFVVYLVALVYQEKQEENELRALPPASAAQLKAVDTSVRETARQHGISDEDFEVRKAVVIRMEEIIKKHLSGCVLWCHSA